MSLTFLRFTLYTICNVCIEEHLTKPFQCLYFNKYSNNKIFLFTTSPTTNPVFRPFIIQPNKEILISSVIKYFHYMCFIVR